MAGSVTSANSALARAVAALKAGKPAEALPALREADRLMPGNAAILHDIGLTSLECGKPHDAVAALTNCVAIQPGYTDAHLRLGMALEAVGQPSAALGAYRRATELQPDLAEAHYRAGKILDSAGWFAQAEDAYRRAASAFGATAMGRIAAAKAQLSAGRLPEAEATLRQALALEPANATAHELLGHTLAELGDFAQARAHLLRAIDNDPRRIALFYDIARAGRLTADDAPLVARTRAAVGENLPPDQMARLHLALGKAADDAGDQASAMREFDTAQTLRDSELRFDPDAFDARVDRLIGCFTPDFIAGQATRAGGPSPIVIVGLPRSGTTLLEQILSSHPDVEAGGELPFWNERGWMWERDGGVKPNREYLAAAAADYAQVLHRAARGSRRVTDKMPLNFQWCGFIHLAMPRATIIHCNRDPLDTALSIHQTWFNTRSAFPTGGEALVRYIRAYQRLTAHWRAVLPPARFVDVRYEHLTERPEPVVRALLDACGLPWHAACLNPEQNRRGVRTASKWQARQPIYRGSVGRARAYGPYLGALAALADEGDQGAALPA
jgi:tetratricopeptide (TPR) repeat protein